MAGNDSKAPYKKGGKNAKAGNKNMKMYLIIGVCVLVALVAAYFLFMRGGKTKEPTSCPAD